MDSWETTDGFADKSKTLEKPKNCKPNLAGQQATVSEFSVCLQNTWRLVRMCREGGKPTAGRLSSWPGLGLAFLCIKVWALTASPLAPPMSKDRRLSAQHLHSPFCFIWPDGHSSLPQAQGTLWLGHHGNHIQLVPHGLSDTQCIFRVCSRKSF